MTSVFETETTLTQFDPFTASLAPGISLVEASAGTGKTYSITMTVVRLLLEEDDSGKPLVGGIGNILVVTFTNAATNELISRIRDVLRLAYDVFTGASTDDSPTTNSLAELRDRSKPSAVGRLRDALASIDKLAVFTIHGFCKRVLDELALESGTAFGSALLENQDDLIQRALDDWWRKTLYEDPALAGFAVHREWRRAEFLEDFKRWRCWPDTRLEPQVDVQTALGLVAKARSALARCLEGDVVKRYLDSLKWYAGASMGDADFRATILERAALAAAGNLGAAVEFVGHCTSAEMQHGKRGVQKSHPLFAEIPDHAFVKAADALCEALDVLHCALRVSCLEAALKTLDGEKARANTMGFDDLLVRLRVAIEKEGSDGLLSQSIRRRYHAALIDEFQDTDPCQFPIFSTAFRGLPLFLIGDPKQAIYGFRGADVFAYIDAASKAGRRYSLSRNWRSTPEMIHAVNSIFGLQPNAFLYREIGLQQAQAADREPAPSLPSDGRQALHWLLLPPTSRENGTVAITKTNALNRLHGACVGEIVRLVNSGVAAGRIAVLVRTGREGADVAKGLRVAGVPAVVSGMGDILASGEFGEICLLLQAIASPGDGRLVRAAIATEIWGASHEELLRLASPEGEDAWHSVLTTFVELRDTWATRGFMAMMQELSAKQQVLERLLPYSDGDRRLTNFRHVVELLHNASTEQQLSVGGLLHWMARNRVAEERDRKTNELRLDSDADAVQVVTVHSSKGLEYDVVFCPSLWSTRCAKDGESIVVHLEDNGVVFDHGSNERSERGRLQNAERLAEELRLTYVALTRARLRTYVGWGPIESKGKPDASWRSALGFLLSGSATADLTDACDAAEMAASSLAANLGGWEGTLQSLVQANSDSMSWEAVAADAAQPKALTAAQGAAPPIKCRHDLPQASAFQTWSIASYTTLVSGAAVEAVRDVDDGDMANAALMAPKPAATRADFMTFPAGRRPGVVLHELFERSNFADDEQILRERAAPVLQRAGLATDPADDRVSAVTTMMSAVFAAPVGALAFSLKDVVHERTLREWEFLLPLGEVSKQALATQFAKHGGKLGARYAPMLSALPARRVQGFLTGFVDLVFEHGGRWFVVDWKSNQLGSDVGAYSLASLAEVMHSSHYTLQYHLYVLALHRFLDTRVPGYSYETHMGGAAYAFLRGFTHEGHGWYVDRPPLALIEALSTLVDAGMPSAQGAVA